MKKFAAVLFTAFFALGFTAGVVYAQELTFSSELKTGFYIEQEQVGTNDPVATGGMTNTDGDSGTGQGRLRVNFHFTYQNLGLRVRFQLEPNSTNLGPYYPAWNYAYAYGNLFNEQLKLSVGLLGDSPWGTGGSRLRVEPEAREYLSVNDLSKDSYTAAEGLLGIRVEYKPSFVPGLNVGFVLNQPDQTQAATVEQNFGDVLAESVVGVAYEHDYFAVRVGYRFDSKIDTYADPKIDEGGRLIYRLEEKALDNLVEGMKIWLNGEYYGIGCGTQDVTRRDPVTGTPVTKTMGVGEYSVNWLYWLWDTDNFTAQFDVGLGLYKEYNNKTFGNAGLPTERQEYQSLELRPAFYYKFLNNILQAGLGVGFGMEFGPGKTYQDSAYQFISVEPQVRLNIGSYAYVAAIYSFTDKYAWWADKSKGYNEGDKSVKHSVNIRAVYTF